jgi:hypothetical protein
MDEQGPMSSRNRMRKIAHVLFWTAVFYGLAVGIGKLAEWLDAQM